MAAKSSLTLSGADLEQLLQTVQQLAKSAEVLAVSSVRIAEANATANATAIVRQPSPQTEYLEANSRHFSILSTAFAGFTGSKEPDAVKGLAKGEIEKLRNRNVGQKAGKTAIDKNDHTYDRTSGMLWWELGFNVDVSGPNKNFSAPVQEGLVGLEFKIQNDYFGDVSCDITPDALANSKTFTDLYNAIYKAVAAANRI